MSYKLDGWIIINDTFQPLITPNGYKKGSLLVFHKQEDAEKYAARMRKKGEKIGHNRGRKVVPLVMFFEEY